MAVSHKTNNLIHCNRCHLPFNFKNTAPKVLSCKHWYCLNCLEHLLHTGQENEHVIECEQCQKSIDVQGLLKTEQQFIRNYEKTKLQLIQSNNSHNSINVNNNPNNNNNSNNSKSDNNKTPFGCENEFAQKDFDVETNNITRSASLASENSSGSLGYFSNNTSAHSHASHDLEPDFHLGNRCGAPNVNSTIKLLPGENCFIHGMPNTLWCQTCSTVLCRGCNAGAEHKDHKVESLLEAKEFYKNCVQQEFAEIQASVEDMQNFKLLQKAFLLKLLETCCTLKLQIEQELVSNSNNADMDVIRDTMANLQLCFGLLGKQAPYEMLKLHKVIREENWKLKVKHKQMLQQCKMQQLLSKSQRILDFEMLKGILHKLDSSSCSPNDSNKTYESLFNIEPETGNCAANSIMILTNYCIYRLYASYVKHQQQFIQQQFMRYQQYQQEQKQNPLKQYKTPPATLRPQNQRQHLQEPATIPNELITGFYDKQKTYAEIATTRNSHQFDFNENSNGFELMPAPGGFQPYKKPLPKALEEPHKAVQLLFNPINNETNQIYFFDFQRNGQNLGRVLIKVFTDIAPKMSYNFHALATHEKGFGYIGCKVFECHPNESIITGDIEQNTGYSSRSIYEDVQFIPDETNVAPFAGAVGMRRAKKKFDSQGLVGSQFRIILTELGFTAIFGCVIEGLDVVKKISQTLVQNDKMHGANGSSSNGALNSVVAPVGGVASANSSMAVSGIFIAQCGLYEFVKRDIMCGI